MEPERKIEKLLRAYARKRRADAGDPLTLHPATRRLLQGEVARRKPKPEDDEEESVTLWELFRQRWALLAGFALIIFFGAALFLPALSKSKSKSLGVSTLSNLKQPGTAAQQMAELTNRERSQLVATDDSARRQLQEVPVALKDAGLNAAAAPPIAGQPKSEPVRLDAKIGDSGATAGLLAANAPAAAAPAVDRLAKAPGAAGVDLKTTSGSVQFATAGAQNSFKNTLAPAKAAVVLANFQVQQNGSAIRVVDADGSVYDGALQPENEVAQSAPAQAEGDRQKVVATRDEPQMAQNYFFRVVGTNLTLKQNVVFAGNLLANASAATNGQQAYNRNVGFGGGGGQLQSALTNQLPWSQWRIAGTAVVSDTNSIEINAVPQSP